MTPKPVLPTPVLTDHARERCAEMGISTKVAKQIARNPDLAYICRNGKAMVGHSKRHPDYAVIYQDESPFRRVVVTVLFSARDFAYRAGTTYVPIGVDLG